MLKYSYNNSCKTYNEFLKKISDVLEIDNSKYFFYSEIEDKQYGIFNESSFQLFQEAIKNKNEKKEIICKEKKKMIKEYMNSLNKNEENTFDISNLKKDDTTNEIDDIIGEYIEKYTKCLEEIKNRKDDLTKSRIEELQKISYDSEANDLFIDQITFENVIQNCGPLPIPNDNVSKYLLPKKKESCYYCGRDDIKQLYGCETCGIKICEYCFQGLKTYQHFHRLSLYKTN